MRNKLLIFILQVVFLVSIASAYVNIEINVLPEFHVGETIKFDYSFLADSDEIINYVPSVKCTNLPDSILERRTLSLKKGEIARETYEGAKIEDETVSQQCLATIKIEKPFIRIKEEDFEVINLETIDFNLNICKDSNCLEKSKTFLNKEKVYFDYLSSISGLNVNSVLSFPDGSKKQISIPSFIDLEQEGTYGLEVTASKQGYKTITKKEQFGVISENAEIKSEIVCNADSVCNGIENKQNCPQDCVKTSIFKNISNLFLFILAIAIVLAVIFIAFSLKRKKKKKKR